MYPGPGLGGRSELIAVGELGEFPADPVQGRQDLAVTGDRPAELVNRYTKAGQGLANVPVVLVLAVVQRAELLGEPLHLQECGGDAAVLGAHRAPEVHECSARASSWLPVSGTSAASVAASTVGTSTTARAQAGNTAQPWRRARL